jgi:MFS family permease
MLVMLGNSLVGNFAQYYFGDVVRTFALPYIGTVAKTAERAVSFFIFTVLIGSLMTTTIAGHLSDKHGRKIIVFAAGSIMSAVCLTLIFTADFTTTVIMGWVFGLGAGAFLTVDWALVSDVLPSDSDYAKDMGVWHGNY